MCDCVFLACFGACAAALFVVGFYFFFGVIFIALASNAKAVVSTHQGLISNDLSLFPNLCITIGVLYTSLTVIGLAGQRRGRKTRIFYAVSQALVVILGLYIYIDGYPDEAKLEKHLFEGLSKTIQNYGVVGTSADKGNITAEWDKLQENLECCGIRNYLDWEHTPYASSESSSSLTPISCCREEHRMKGCSNFVFFDNPVEANKIIHVQGCLKEVQSVLLLKMEILHYFLVPILILTSVGCMVSCCSSGVKKDTEMTEKKVGPIIVRTKTKKSKGTDAENPEEKEADKDTEPVDVELQKLNPPTAEVVNESGNK